MNGQVPQEQPEEDSGGASGGLRDFAFKKGIPLGLLFGLVALVAELKIPEILGTPGLEPEARELTRDRWLVASGLMAVAVGLLAWSVLRTVRPPRFRSPFSTRGAAASLACGVVAAVISLGVVSSERSNWEFHEGWFVILVCVFAASGFVATWRITERDGTMDALSTAMLVVALISAILIFAIKLPSPAEPYTPVALELYEPGFTKYEQVITEALGRDDLTREDASVIAVDYVAALAGSVVTGAESSRGIGYESPAMRCRRLLADLVWPIHTIVVSGTVRAPIVVVPRVYADRDGEGTTDPERAVPDPESSGPVGCPSLELYVDSGRGMVVFPQEEIEPQSNTTSTIASTTSTSEPVASTADRSPRATSPRPQDPPGITG